jgi:hypothetical protein
MVRNPRLATRNDGIFPLSRAREPCKRLLTDVMPVDKVDAGGLLRGDFDVGEARD